MLNLSGSKPQPSLACQAAVASVMIRPQRHKKRAVLPAVNIRNLSDLVLQIKTAPIYRAMEVNSNRPVDEVRYRRSSSLGLLGRCD